MKNNNIPEWSQIGRYRSVTMGTILRKILHLIIGHDQFLPFPSPSRAPSIFVRCLSTSRPTLLPSTHHVCFHGNLGSCSVAPIFDLSGNRFCSLNFWLVTSLFFHTYCGRVPWNNPRSLPLTCVHLYFVITLNFDAIYTALRSKDKALL
jgi:hypothetical protein